MSSPDGVDFSLNIVLFCCVTILKTTAFLSMSYMQLHSYLQFTQNLHLTKFIGRKVSTLHTGLVYRIAIKDAEKDILFNKEREK